MIRSENLKYYFILIFLIIFSHFIPFERASLAPDDYSFFLIDKIGFKNFLIYPDRPIQFFWYEIQNVIINNNINISLIAIVFANILTILSCFILYNIFFNNYVSFLVSIINILLFIKLEIFHNAIMIHILLVSSLYIFSLIFLLKFLNYEKRIYYYFSLILYLFSVFWYEIGFFLPILIFLIKNNSFGATKIIKKKIAIFFPYLMIMLFYAVYRLTNVFGLSEINQSHTISINIFSGLYDLFNHHLGRYFFKNLIYGILQFKDIKYTYLIIILTFNIFFFLYLFKHIYKVSLKNKNMLFFIFLFLLSLIPMILNGEAGGRNLIISSISFSYFIFLIILKFKNYFKQLYLLIVFFTLIVCQGNSWSQVIASRIQNSIFNTMEYHKNEIENADYFIFNPKSLANKIDYSLVNNNYNLINTYYGAQVWEIWGIKGFLTKNNFKIKSGLIVVNENPEITSTKITLSKIIQHEDYSIKNKSIELDNKNLFIMDYNKIYKFGFDNGKQVFVDE